MHVNVFVCLRLELKTFIGTKDLTLSHLVNAIGIQIFPSFLCLSRTPALASAIGTKTFKTRILLTCCVTTSVDTNSGQNQEPFLVNYCSQLDNAL